jgi:hypothetical protein
MGMAPATIERYKLTYSKSKVGGAITNGEYRSQETKAST